MSNIGKHASVEVNECAGCRFFSVAPFRGSRINDQLGECRRRAPTVLEIANRLDYKCWPRVKMDDSCGEFEAEDEHTTVTCREIGEFINAEFGLVEAYTFGRVDGVGLFCAYVRWSHAQDRQAVCRDQFLREMRRRGMAGAVKFLSEQDMQSILDKPTTNPTDEETPTA